MSFYHSLITAATGVSDEAILSEIEDTMREVIFHSTLNWQTEEQLTAAAVEARAIVDYANSPAGIADYESYLSSWDKKS